MRDDRDPPRSSSPSRPGARPFVGGQSSSSRPPDSASTTPRDRAPQGSAPKAFARPFVPKPAGEPAATEPRWPAPPPDAPAASPPEPGSAGRRTPRMLAALVEDDQVSLWHVMPGGEPPLPPASMPNEISFLHVDGTPAEAQETGWGIDTPVEPSLQLPMELPGEPARPEEASPAEDLFERLAASLPEPLPFETPALELELSLGEPLEHEDAEPGTPAPEMLMPELEVGGPTAPQRRAAEALEAMARRVRNGEIVLPQGPSGGSEAAVLAAVLTALLEGRD